MNRTLLTIVVASALAITAVTAAVATLSLRAEHDPAAPAQEHHEAGADERLLRHGMAGDLDHDGDGHPDVGMERPAFPPAEGSVPSADDARSLQEVSRLIIHGDGDLLPANGVRSGNGTLDDPYVVSGYYVTGDLYISDTDACIVIFGNYIGGQLSLNWNGQCVHVHHNYIRDLRVNENIPRDGYATGGLLEQNEISFVGQLRHYDGEFRHNVIGPFAPGDVWDTILETVPVPFVEDFRVANIDGFNEALLHHNTFHGSVDLDLHGHHHGAGFFAPHSHYHGEDMDKMASHEHDHTLRWTSVFFTDNHIIDAEGYGLRYEDQNHAGDDRTANSEQVEQLEENHKHWTWVTIARNTVEGSGIWVDVFNADDRNHDRRNPGWLDILDNTVILQERERGPLEVLIRFGYEPTVGIQVYAAKEVETIVQGNTVTWKPAESSDPVQNLLGGLFSYRPDIAGIGLLSISDANLTVTGNTIDGFEYGIHAHHMDEMVKWVVADNDIRGALQDIWYDETVANEPSES